MASLWPEEWLGDLKTLNAVMDNVDVETTLIVGWSLLGLFVVLMVVFVYRRHLRPEKSQSAAASTTTKTTSSTKKADSKPYGFGRTPKATVSGDKSPASVTGSSGGVKTTLQRPQRIFSVIGIDKYAVEWANRMLAWIFNDLTVYSGVVEQWVRQLNGVTSTAVTEHGIQVSFERIQPESLPPSLNNATIEVTPQDDIIFTCNVVVSKLAFIICTSRRKGDTVMETVYQAKITSYAGKLKAHCNPYELVVSSAFVDRPSLNVALKAVSDNQGVDVMDEHALQTVLIEIVSAALSTWILKLNFAGQTGCPKFSRPDLSALPVKPIHYDSMTPVATPIFPRSKHDKRLLVKIIKASGLGTVKGCKEPFCIVEMDEPSQKHQTSFGQNTDSPFWDEHFLFDLNHSSSELLFELYDKAKVGKDGFLGLGIVSVDDLLKKPSQRQIILLQNRPYEEDAVSGSVTVEFLLMEPMDVPIVASQNAQTTHTEMNRSITPSGSVLTTTTTTISKQSNGTDVMANGGDPVTDTALRELEGRLLVTTPTPTNKSTLIIHSVQREVARPSVKMERTKNGEWHEVTQSQIPEVFVVDGDKESVGEGTIGTAESIASSSISSRDGSGRARPRDRRSFMNTLRKRFSFRSKRSKSTDQPGVQVNDDREGSLSRSVSVDRPRGTAASGAGKQPGPFLGIPGSVSRADVGSTRSSLSDTSTALSQTSTQTYLSEASTLVIETIENNVLKHYLLPASMATKSKWRKRGTKLHIYNDHTFVAKHFSGGSTPCQVCHRNLPRRMGKQGYECRDCHLPCHKQCHVKSEVPCPNSTVNTLELSYEIFYGTGKKAGNGVAMIPVANGESARLLHRRPLSVVTEE